MGFKEFISKFAAAFEGLLRLANSRDNSLGDRATYIGSSDVAKCPSRVVAEKMHRPEHSLKTLLTFARGHLTELVIRSVLVVGKIRFVHQLKLQHPEFPWIRAHLDYVSFDGISIEKSTALTVKEIKSPEVVPEEPDEDHLLQLYFQMGLLKLKYPGKAISGSIFYLSLLEGDFNEFGPFEPNDAIFAGLIAKAHHLKACLDGTAEPETVTNLYCGSCSIRLSCSAFASDSPPLPEDLQVAVAHYANLKSEKAAIEAQMDDIKQRVIAFTGGKFKNPVGNHLLVITEQGTTWTADSKLLEKEYPDVYQAVKKPKKGFLKMEVK